MAIIDRGKRGLEIRNKPLRLGPGSYLDPCAAGPFSFEDFNGAMSATLNDFSGRVEVAQSGSAVTKFAISATAGAPVAGHGGWALGGTDDVDDEIDEIRLGEANWLFPVALPTGGILVAEAGLVLPALTARMHFFGLSGAASTATADGPISITSGTTLVDGSAGGDAAGFIFSSLATDSDNWYTGTVKATAVGTAYNTSSGTQGEAAAVVTADDYTRLRVEIDASGNVFFYYGLSTTLARAAVPLKYMNTVAAGVTASDGFAPFFSAATTTTTEVQYEIDYLFGAASHA